ncbi:hypothetical protein JCM33374_g3470 [Metschnikowia sp. JCM 33374]|nr:hypothetical protein JCM33374_g3470 [Metschnikowia sp. JCM 33374]
MRLSAHRTVFVLSAQKKRRTKTKKENLQRWNKTEDTKKPRRNQTQVPRISKEVRGLTESLSDYVKSRQIGESEKAKVTSADELSDNKSCNAYKSDDGSKSKPEIPLGETKEFDPKDLSLLTPSVEIPLSFQDKLGPATRYLVSKENQNWFEALKQIEASGGFHNIPELDIRKLVYNIPKNQLTIVFPQIERLLQEAGIQKSPKVVNAYLKGLVYGGKISDEKLELMEHYMKDLRSSAKKGILSRETYEILIEAYGKTSRIDRMEAIINEMKSAGLQPTSNVYSSVLNTCVYKTRDHKQAVQLFDSMKFLAGSMAPGTTQYQDVIVSYVNNNDIERALDLYEEMSTNGVPVNQKILVALAKGCATRKHLRLKAWDFIFDIYERKWEPMVPTIEYMIYLAAKDGDLSLARALYQQLNVSGAVSPRSFGFLMLSYSSSGITQDLDKYTVPAVAVHQSGRNFRQNIIERTDFMPQLSNPKQAVPFLPMKSLMSTAELLSESSAVMAHALIVNPGLVSEESVNMFLNVASKIGSMEEFVDRYNNFTYFDGEGVPSTRNDANSVIVEEPETQTQKPGLETDSETGIGYQKSTNYTKSPILNIGEGQNRGIQFSRTTKTYMIALRAAARHKDYMFSKKIWQERGNYRKSTTFRGLTPQEKKHSDFMFAATMVKCLTDLALLDDALAILVSTEYQFKWTWKELKPLHIAAVEVGHDQVSKTVRGIARRAQEKFEGKIKRKDFKKYVSIRGY